MVNPGPVLHNVGERWRKSVMSVLPLKSSSSVGWHKKQLQLQPINFTAYLYLLSSIRQPGGPLEGWTVQRVDDRKPFEFLQIDCDPQKLVFYTSHSKRQQSVAAQGIEKKNEWCNCVPRGRQCIVTLDAQPG